MNPARARSRVLSLVTAGLLVLSAGAGSVAAQAAAAGHALPGLSGQTVKIPADTTDAGSFGIAAGLSADGTTAIVGATQHNFDRGGAYVFQQAGGTWSKTADLTPAGLQYGDSYGNAVAISADGSLAMVGEVGWHQLSGRVLIFQKTAQGWAAAGQLEAPVPTPYTHFGDAISMDAAGDRVVIGALGTGGFVGSAYVFNRGSGGQWTRAAALQPLQPAGQLDFGTAVSMSRDGSAILVGANAYKDATGAAYVFRYAAGQWTQQAMLTAAPGQGQAGAYFGTSVALDSTGSAALIGAVYENNGAGAGYLFQSGASGWTQTARLTEPGTGQYGNAVALNAAGSVAAVGAEATQVTGTAYVYARTAAGWVRAMRLAPDVSSQALYGIAVSLDATGGEAMIGAAFDDNGQPGESGFGAVYVVPVQVASTCGWQTC
jgi:hypothetical protein